MQQKSNQIAIEKDIRKKKQSLGNIREGQPQLKHNIRAVLFVMYFFLLNPFFYNFRQNPANIHKSLKRNRPISLSLYGIFFVAVTSNQCEVTTTSLPYNNNNYYYYYHSLFRIKLTFVN